MNLKDFSNSVELTRSELKTKGMDNTHMLFGMMTEVGELVDVFKKNMAYGKEIDWINIQEEVGDLMWYIIGFCTINEFDIEEILARCSAKLQVRYKDKFTAKEALNRDLDREREILETTNDIEKREIK